MQITLRLLAVIASAAIALVAAVAPPDAGPVSAHSLAGKTVATGLDNPRGLVVLGDDRLVVAEAGHAGTVCPLDFCMGLNGQVTSLRLGDHDRTVLASGLPSTVGPFGAFGLGG